ncbi:MAG TPA: GTPase ObgE [Candidatus Kapabacteria bacterium]|nr:GTPase ObgE [Candidatus Kapabacteria bacterium]
MFIDSAEITVRAGRGGNGVATFRREKFVPKGGPNGGDGGDGGDVVFVASTHIATLMDFRYQHEYAAENGQNGAAGNKTGRNGKTIEIKVPVGTIVRDVGTGDLVADFVEDGQAVVIARHGDGGRGNSHFATSTNQAPRYAEKGRPGEERHVSLELKLLADIGLVGFPNAGKSTLISRISAARPKIADYPFTTLVPNLGIVRVDEGESFVVADIPGLIEGASEGKGLGLQFLRHVERSGVLCFLIDGLSDDPVQDYETLTAELQRYNPEMLHKRRLVCITKADALPAERIEELRGLRFDGIVPMMISSVSGFGIDELVPRMSRELKAWREEE